jgi:hypothetical protein
VQRDHFTAWFSAPLLDGDLDGRFAHTRLIQLSANGWECVREELISYIERAHQDAREFFCTEWCLSLDPFGSEVPAVVYPGSLPQDTLLGYFGEAFCGMIAEGQELIGRRTWTVPVFLFRLHNQAGEHLHRLIFGERVPKSIMGRTGSDFIGLCLDEERRVVALLVGEAKCQATLNITVAKKALKDLGEQAATPVSLGQLRTVLRSLPGDGWNETVRSIEEILLTRSAVERTDLFVYIFEDPGVVNYSAPRLPQSVVASEHGLRRRIQVAEVQIPDLRRLVSTIYTSAYQPREVHSASG